MFKLVFFIFG